MLTKEDIIAGHLGGYHETRDDFTTDVVIPSMDYYARQVAIEFVTFVGQIKDGQIKMPKNTMNWNELFDLYLKSK